MVRGQNTGSASVPGASGIEDLAREPNSDLIVLPAVGFDPMTFLTWALIPNQQHTHRNPCTCFRAECDGVVVFRTMEGLVWGVSLTGFIYLFMYF